MRKVKAGLVAVASLALIYGGAVSTAASFSTYGKAFCMFGPVGGLQRAVDQLPPVREPPQGRPLPFGPDFLTMSGGGRFLLSPGQFGYRLIDERFGSRRRPITLDWDVTTTLTRIDKRGNAGPVVDQRHAYLGTVTDFEARQFSVSVPARRSLYRFDIEFVDRATGKPLGAYAQYLRLVRKTYHARLAVNRRNVRPRQPVFARVENRGSSWIGFGADYAVQRWTENGWEAAPGFDVEGWPAIAYMMGGATSGHCIRYRPPASAPPGRYRFVRHLDWWGHKSKKAVATFGVTRR